MYGRPRYFPPQARLVERFDRLGDGRLHYHEFVRMLSATRAEQHDDPIPSVRLHEAPADELARLQLENARMQNAALKVRHHELEQVDSHRKSPYDISCSIS